MTQADTLYRAFGGLVRELEENRSVTALTNAVAGAPEPDSVVVTHNVCHVREDWIAAIERGLTFIGNAIGEDRQFIRSNGEIQPIEKVRHISKESVQHLSRHSDLISREPKGDDIIPDKLYTVERLSDYTVYENRFLYLLLCRIRDFVAVRYEAIIRSYKNYRGEYRAQKTVTLTSRKLTFSVELKDIQEDALSASADAECAGFLTRLEKIQGSVSFFLRTPLMVEVSRVDKIKSKITKTNVLRMDKNFKEAVSLYEFLLSYEGDGYVIEEVVTRLDPVSEPIAKELAIPAMLSAFLVYEHGLGIEDYLREEFEKEEARREEQRQLALLEEIAALKKRIAETGMGMEEYVLKLEERNAALEKDRLLLFEAREEIERLNGVIEELNGKIEELGEEIARLTEENGQLAEKLERSEEEHRRKMEELRLRHAEELAQAEAAHREELERAEEAHREEIARVRTECDGKIREIRAQIAQKEAQIAQKEKEKQGVKQELAGAKRDLSGMGKEVEVLRARITALRKETGKLGDGDDFTTEEGFNALEHEFEVLGRLVREEWTDVKKILRKEFFGSIRATMKSKGKAQKSGEYEALSAEVRDRAARAKKAEPKASGGPGPGEKAPPAPTSSAGEAKGPPVREEKSAAAVREEKKETPAREETAATAAKEEIAAQPPESEEKPIRPNRDVENASKGGVEEQTEPNGGAKQAATIDQSAGRATGEAKPAVRAATGKADATGEAKPAAGKADAADGAKAATGKATAAGEAKPAAGKATAAGGAKAATAAGEAKPAGRAAAGKADAAGGEKD